jgi:hypothetical protein
MKVKQKFAISFFQCYMKLAMPLKKHISMKFDKISEMENQAQENEANAVALEWFNQHVKELNNPYAKQITL